MEARSRSDRRVCRGVHSRCGRKRSTIHIFFSQRMSLWICATSTVLYARVPLGNELTAVDARDFRRSEGDCVRNHYHSGTSAIFFLFLSVSLSSYTSPSCAPVIVTVTALLFVPLLITSSAETLRSSWHGTEWT